jgi:hypothetical protein
MQPLFFIARANPGRSDSSLIKEREQSRSRPGVLTRWRCRRPASSFPYITHADCR